MSLADCLWAHNEDWKASGGRNDLARSSFLHFTHLHNETVSLKSLLARANKAQLGGVEIFVKLAAGFTENREALHLLQLSANALSEEINAAIGNDQPVVG
jgi:hypothetical protein